MNLLAHLRREGFIRDGMEVRFSFSTVGRAEGVLDPVGAALRQPRPQVDAAISEKF